MKTRHSKYSFAQWRSQPKNWGGAKNLGGIKNTILLVKTLLKAQNHYIFQKFGGSWSLWPPWLRQWLCIQYSFRYQN